MTNYQKLDVALQDSRLIPLCKIPRFKQWTAPG
jgi:hypothetical protein